MRLRKRLISMAMTGLIGLGCETKMNYCPPTLEPMENPIPAPPYVYQDISKECVAGIHYALELRDMDAFPDSLESPFDALGVPNNDGARLMSNPDSRGITLGFDSAICNSTFKVYLNSTGQDSNAEIYSVQYVTEGDVTYGVVSGQPLYNFVVPVGEEFREFSFSSEQANSVEENFLKSGLVKIINSGNGTLGIDAVLIENN